MSNKPQHEEWKVKKHSVIEDVSYIVDMNGNDICTLGICVAWNNRLQPVFVPASGWNSESNAQAIVTAHNVMPEVVEVIEEFLRGPYWESKQPLRAIDVHERTESTRLKARDLLARIGGGENG